MALSGSTGSNVGSYWRLELDWSATQNIGGNYSDVSVSLYWVSTRSTSAVYSSASKSGYIIIDGSRTNFTATAGLSGNQRKRIATASKRIYHGSDGAKSFSISANFGMAVTLSGTYYSSRTISGSWSLNTIPRKTGVSLGNSTANFGGTIRVNFDRKSSSFTHTVSYSFGGSSGVIWDKITWGNADWNVPLSLMSQIPNATSGWGSIHVDTYNGTTNLGRNSVRFTLNVPSNITPSFSSLTASETNSTVSNAGIGAYVQGMSNVKLTINGASGTYGSTINSYSINFDGQVKGNNGVWNPSFSGTKTATATITDSRGRKASRSISIPVISYSPPNISDVSVSRTGTAQTTATVFRSGNLSSLNGKNQITIIVDSKIKDASAWGNATSATGAVGGTTFSSTVTLPGVFDKTNSYDIRIRAIDKFNTVTTIASLSSAFSTLSLGKEGVGIGKIWERGSLDVVGEAYFSGGIFANHPDNPNNEIELITNTDYGNSGIDIKATGSSDSAAYIDFFTHVDKKADADSRIISSKGSAISNFKGQLEIQTGTLKLTADSIEHDGASLLSSGNNSNGEWIRFSNGLQICFALRSINTTVGTATGAWYYTDESGWTYPLQFSSQPVVHISPEGSGNFALASPTGGVSNSRLTGIRLYRSTNASVNQKFSLLAIGRWR